MIVRRIREHVAAHDWFAVLIDLVIAILGVFIGIQAADWNEARGQRAQSREDRQRLIADLDSNRADYENRQAYFRAVQGHAEAALAALERPAGADADGDGGAFLNHAYQASQIAPREAKHVTYDEIVATGRLTRLGAPALRDRVGNYYITLASARIVIDYIPPYRERLRRAMPGAIQLAIRTQCPERYEFLADGTNMFTLAERCRLALDPATVAAGVAAVRKIPDLKEELNRVVGDAGGKGEVLAVNLREIGILRAMIVAADAR